MPSTDIPDWIHTPASPSTPRCVTRSMGVKRQLAERRAASETKYNPHWRDQPRLPRGASNGGRWIDGGGANQGVEDRVIRVRLGPLNHSSRYARRSRRYATIQIQLEGAGFRDTLYFEAVSKMTANLANMDNTILGWMANLNPQVRVYSNWLSQAIADYNESQLSGILSGAIRERGQALDSRVVRDEQRFIQVRLDNLARNNPSRYRDFVEGINRNANMNVIFDAFSEAFDPEIGEAADRTRRILGGPIDFANVRHRTIMGQQMVAVLRSRN
jgi:hypothetical protein